MSEFNVQVALRTKPYSTVFYKSFEDVRTLLYWCLLPLACAHLLLSARGSVLSIRVKLSPKERGDFTCLSFEVSPSSLLHAVNVIVNVVTTNRSLWSLDERVSILTPL